jgi:endogenous inhibitor of DNA gyrase (YacG/DUF329 family)
MAAYLSCKGCGRRQYFEDRQPMTTFCSHKCQQVYEWLRAKPAEESLQGRDGPREKVLRLVALAVNPAAAPGESANAAIAACRLLEKHRLLDVPQAASLSMDDLMRWAATHPDIARNWR